jgi:hypothetical protein
MDVFIPTQDSEGPVQAAAVSLICVQTWGASAPTFRRPHFSTQLSLSLPCSHGFDVAPSFDMNNGWSINLCQIYMSPSLDGIGFDVGSTTSYIYLRAVTAFARKSRAKRRADTVAVPRAWLTLIVPVGARGGGAGCAFAVCSHRAVDVLVLSRRAGIGACCNRS